MKTIFLVMLRRWLKLTTSHKTLSTMATTTTTTNKMTTKSFNFNSDEFLLESIIDHRWQPAMLLLHRKLEREQKLFLGRQRFSLFVFSRSFFLALSFFTSSSVFIEIFQNCRRSKSLLTFCPYFHAPLTFSLTLSLSVILARAHTHTHTHTHAHASHTLSDFLAILLFFLVNNSCWLKWGKINGQSCEVLLLLLYYR